MFLRNLIIIGLVLLVATGIGWAAAGRAPASDVTVHGEAEVHHELPLAPVEIAAPLGFPITNSMLVTWIVAAGLIAFAQLATRRLEMVPQGLQNFWEWLVESLYNFLEGIIGSDLVRKTFWFFASIFIFILFANWFGLIPGVGTVGWYVTYEDGSKAFLPWFRGANADLNMTFAMAIVFFICWTYWALRENGVGGFLLHIFGAKGDTTGALKLLMGIVFLLVGLLEVVSILFRPISLSFRLFGNVYAGESMLEAMANLVPGWLGAIIIPIPFYFLEVLVGLVQALVFMLLTAVFTLLICQHEEGIETGPRHHH